MRGLFLLLLLLSCSCSSLKSWSHLPQNDQDKVKVVVASHGWHTGFILQRQHLGELAFLVEELGEAPYYEIGWGDAGFYQAPEITASLAIKAMCWPTPTVIHAVAVKRTPERYFSQSELCTLVLSKRGHQKLLRELGRAFQRNKQGKPWSTRQGIYGKSRFFPARGRYFAGNTCNTWTARVLSRSGVPVTSWFTLFRQPSALL